MSRSYRKTKFRDPFPWKKEWVHWDNRRRRAERRMLCYDLANGVIEDYPTKETKKHMGRFDIWWVYTEISKSYKGRLEIYDCILNERNLLWLVGLETSVLDNGHYRPLSRREIQEQVDSLSGEPKALYQKYHYRFYKK